jgi:subtilisin family serine protease
MSIFTRVIRFSVFGIIAASVQPSVSKALASSSDKIYIRFSNEESLKQFLMNNPESQRVHPMLPWVEASEQQSFLESSRELASRGIDKVERNQWQYRIPKPVVSAQEFADIPNQKLWGITKIGSPQAWRHTQGGRDVIVAVIDTGIDYNHPALSGNMWTNDAELNGRPGVDDDGNGNVDDIHGVDFISGRATPLDDEGHGSHVAGTIAGRRTGDAFFGVAPNVRLMAIKTHNAAGEGSKLSVVKGILYAADHGARVLNCSWGGAPEAGEFDQMLFDAIAYANNKGAVLIASAGNNSANNDVGIHYPSNYELPGIISVASSNPDDRRSYFSNYGSKTVDLAAPGSNILSAARGGQGYVSLSGTSMASPHVSGAVALLASTEAGRRMTPAQLREALMDNVEKSSVWNNRVISGGRLNVEFIGKASKAD